MSEKERRRGGEKRTESGREGGRERERDRVGGGEGKKDIIENEQNKQKKCLACYMPAAPPVPLSVSLYPSSISERDPVAHLTSATPPSPDSIISDQYEKNRKRDE